MTVVALIFAGIAAALHIVFFKLESIDWKKPKTWKGYGAFKGNELQAHYSMVQRGKMVPMMATFRYRKLAIAMRDLVGDPSVHIRPVTITLSEPKKRRRKP